MPTKVYKGRDASIIVNGTTIGVAESATAEITTNVEPYWEIGEKYPAALMEGNIEITGDITRAVIDTNLLNFITDATTKEFGVLTTFDVLIRLGPVGSGLPAIYVEDCLPEGESIDVPQDGVVSETFTYRGTKPVLTVS